MKEKKETARIEEIDFLKGVLIVLMISFHLVFIEQKYPYVKQVVYAFHMPAFLLVSGYLMNIDKSWQPFFRTIVCFLIPYVVMESGYIVMASLLPINEHIEQLTAEVFVEKLLFHPIGPYWYLQTLIVCGLTYYVVFRRQSVRFVTRVILLGMLYGCYAYFVKIIYLPYALYFLGGAVLRQSGISFWTFFMPSPLAVVAIVLLTVFPQHLHAESVGSTLIVWTAVSSIFLFHQHASQNIRRIVCFPGRHTLSLFLFSPIFTFLCKFLVPYLEKEPTGLLFLMVALSINIGGCLCIAWTIRSVMALHDRTEGGPAGRGVRSGPE